MDAGTKKKLLWSGVIIFVALPLLCYGVGLVLVWVADTWGIWVGARSVLGGIPASPPESSPATIRRYDRFAPVAQASVNPHVSSPSAFTEWIFPDTPPTDELRRDSLSHAETAGGTARSRFR